MTAGTAITNPSTEKAPERVPTVHLPTVILLRTPGYSDTMRDALYTAMEERGWYVTAWRADGWYLQRGGARVVLVDLHHANGLDSDPITVGQVRARCGEPAHEDDTDYQPQELRLMTGSDEYPRPTRYDPNTVNMIKQPGAFVLNVDKVIGYVDEALKQKWCKNRDARLTRR